MRPLDGDYKLSAPALDKQLHAANQGSGGVLDPFQRRPAHLVKDMHDQPHHVRAAQEFVLRTEDPFAPRYWHACQLDAVWAESIIGFVKRPPRYVEAIV